MSAAKLRSDQRSASGRRATLTLKSGKTYVCDSLEWHGHRLHIVGRLRVANLSGTRFYATRAMTFARSQVERIDWHREKTS